MSESPVGLVPGYMNSYPKLALVMQMHHLLKQFLTAQERFLWISQREIYRFESSGCACKMGAGHREVTVSYL